MAASSGQAHAYGSGARGDRAARLFVGWFRHSMAAKSRFFTKSLSFIFDSIHCFFSLVKTRIEECHEARSGLKVLDGEGLPRTVAAVIVLNDGVEALDLAADVVGKGGGEEVALKPGGEGGERTGSSAEEASESRRRSELSSVWDHLKIHGECGVA